MTAAAAAAAASRSTGDRSIWTHPGVQMLQIPGPSNVPAKVLEAIGRPSIDHRGPEFAALLACVLPKLGQVGGTRGEVVVYPSSGTGAWEAALVNAVAPGRTVLMYETGHFARLWADLAERVGLRPELLEGDWRSPVDPTRIAERLRRDRGDEIAAVAIVHNESSTGVTSSVPDLRAAIDSVGHRALLMVDAVSSLGAVEYHHDAWGVDVTISASQKGLMLPPGLGVNLVGKRALDAAMAGGSPRSYWDWHRIIDANRSGGFPYTPSTNLFFGLDVALEMILDEGLPAVAARHEQLAHMVHDAVESWNLELVCQPADARSTTVTAIMTAGDIELSRLVRFARERFGLVLGAGLGRHRADSFRIGHLGDLDEPRLTAALVATGQSLDLARR